MQVLKFGGTSVANADNISKVVAIIKSKSGISLNTSFSPDDNRGRQDGGDKTIVVVSALGGITDILLSAASLAAEGDEAFKEKLHLVEQRHLEAAKQLIPVAYQSQLLSLVKKSCNEIEDICNGIFLLRELTPRSKDRISSYGEWLSSQIIAAKLKAEGLETVWKDARELITTNSNFT
ncbi:MAG: amino acid kinase family protein, partial [Chitinophagaceae bacterium]